MRSIKDSNRVWNVFFYNGEQGLKNPQAQIFLEFCQSNGELLNIGGVNC
jgi:hypothetical protein